MVRNRKKVSIRAHRPMSSNCLLTGTSLKLFILCRVENRNAKNTCSQLEIPISLNFGKLHIVYSIVNICKCYHMKLPVKYIYVICISSDSRTLISKTQINGSTHFKAIPKSLL